MTVNNFFYENILSVSDFGSFKNTKNKKALLSEWVSQDFLSLRNID